MKMGIVRNAIVVVRPLRLLFIVIIIINVPWARMETTEDKERKNKKILRVT